MNFALVMPAAGRGDRLGAPLSKTLISLSGAPLFLHALRPFLALPECSAVVIAAPRELRDEYRAQADREPAAARIEVVAGGDTRQQSVALALDAVSRAVDAVLIHDAARPCVAPELIRRVLFALGENCAGAIPGIPVTDTLKRASAPSGLVDSTLDREGLFAVQTPQAFLRPVILAAHANARRDGISATDDAALVERYRLGPVLIVPGDPQNIKVTTPDDLRAAARALAAGSASIT